jgi:hypothetical protein
MASLLRNERLPEATDIGVVECLRDADFPCETRKLFAIAVIVVFVSVFIIVRGAELLRVDDLDRLPLARVARHRLHHRCERARGRPRATCRSARGYA